MDLNPILIAQNNCAYTNSGAFVMGYKLLLPEIFSLSQKEIDKTYQVWKDCIKRLPEGAYIHRVDVFIDTVFDTNVLPDKTYFQKNYKQHFFKRKHLKHEAVVFFGWPKVMSLSDKLSNPFAATVKLKDSADEQQFINEQFRTTIEAEVAFINRSKSFKAIPMSKEELSYFNFQFFNLFEIDVSTTIDFTQNIKEESVNVTVGNKLVGAFAIYNEKQLPNEIDTIKRDPIVQSKQGFYTSMGDLFGLYARTPHILSTIIFRDNKDYWLRKIENKATEFGRLSFLAPHLQAQKESLMKLKESLSGEYNEELIVRANTTLIFWDENPKNFVETKQLYSSIFKESDIMTYYPVGKHMKNLFVTANPFFSNRNSDLNVYPNFLSVPLSFFPLVTNYHNDDTGVFFCDRFNVPFCMDLWDEHKRYIKARNFLMLAPTGEGKSFFLQEYMRQKKEAGEVLVIIDLGKSFQKFAKILGDDAAFIEYKTGEPMGVNPFNRPTDELLDPEKLKSLSEFVFAHIESEKTVQETELIFLRSVIKYYIETRRKALSFADFVHFIIGEEKQIKSKFVEELKFYEFDRMKLFLREFIGEGMYAFLYANDQENATISASLRTKKVVVFEVDAAKDNLKILGVLLQTIKDTIHTNIWSDKSKRGQILFEEFAKQLKFGNLLTQVEFYFQAIRKQEGGIGIVLQSTGQIPKNDTAEAIFENIHTVFALSNQSGYDNMSDRLKIKDEHTLSLLNSLKNNFSGERKYSEVFIQQGDRERVVRLEVSREQYLAFITDGPEQAALTRLMNEQGLTIYEAIEKLK